MDTNKILSADLLDLVFDQRNKDYGAYELRKTYHRRIRKAMFITGGLLLLTLSGFVMANKLNPRALAHEHDKPILTFEEIPIENEVEPPPPPPPPPQEPPQVRTEQFTNFVIAPPDESPDPPPDQDDLDNARIDLVTQDGTIDDNTPPVQNIDDHKGIIVQQQVKDDSPVWDVQVEAQFTGDWRKFLLRNLNAQVGLDNGAPLGTYGVLVQFVVDVDGSISDVRALTSHGYGLEQEATRVIKKATKWEPAFQNGHHVKAYRKQMITFVYGED